MLELLFSILSSIALVGWVVLIGFPRWDFGRDRLVGLAIPMLFALAYLVLFPPLFFQSPGGYGSIDEVATLLMSDPRIMLAAWLHYLAFDLLIGRIILLEAQRSGVPHWATTPPLVLCFLFGPVGWLTFKGVAFVFRRRRERRESLGG
jgi:hypothetical protein